MATSTAALLRVVEPATEEVLAELPHAGVEETDAAVARAKAAFPEWRAVTAADRAKIIYRLRQLQRRRLRRTGRSAAGYRREQQAAKTKETVCGVQAQNAS